MLINWRNWCRLCAKYEGSDIDLFFKLESVSDLTQIIQKYFNLSITPYDGGPTTICENCFQFLIKLKKFADRCAKTDLMFSEFLYGRINTELQENDIQEIRNKFGLDDEEKLGDINMKMISDQLVCTSNPISSDPSIISGGNVNHSNIIVNHSNPEGQLIEKIDQWTDTYDLESEVKEEDGEYVSALKKRARRFKKFEDTDANYSTIKGEEDGMIYYTEIEAADVGSDYEEEDNHNNNDEDEDDDEEEDNNIETTGLHSEITSDESKLDLAKQLQSLVEVNINTDMKKEKKRKKSNDDFQPTKCDVCGKEFTRKSSLISHLKSKHGTNELPFVCSKCPKRFNTEKKVKLHETVHLPASLKLIHPCAYCDKKFSKAVNVQAHIKAIHHGERPFICEECGKSFGTKGALKEHQITHSDEKPFTCHYCPKKFKNLARLRTHEDIHNDTMYVCPHCGLRLNTKRTLKMHMVVHSDAKKYKCQYCGNEYKRSKALKNHLILHTGLRPYVCPFCDKTFANGSNCRSHKKKSHPDELAAAEAAGDEPRVTNIPKLEQLQPKISSLDDPSASTINNLIPIVGQQIIQQNGLPTPDIHHSNQIHTQLIQDHTSIPLQINDQVQVPQNLQLPHSIITIPLISPSNL